jgi:O-antigen/teichoic acid export membrane protein
MTVWTWVFKERQRAGRHRRETDLLPVRLRHLSREGLIRNSALLVGNLGLTAVCGFGSVSLLTRLYSVQAVGLSAAALSAGGLIGFITQFGINYSLPRFLPQSKHRAALLNTVLTATLLATFLGSIIFLLLPVADRLYALGGGLFVVAFLIGTTLDAGETNLEIVFIADRKVSKIASANVIANVVKLAAPITLVFLGMLGAYLSRIIYGIAEFFILGVILQRGGHRYKPMLSMAATRDLHRFSMGSYIGSLFGTLPTWLLPIVILSRFGAGASAYWYTAMAIASLLYQIPGSVARALLVEVAHRPADRRNLVRNAAKVVCVVTLPVLIVSYVTAPIVLSAFGHGYVQGGLTALRWLIVAGLLSAINYITGTVILLAKRTSLVAIGNAVNAVVVLVLAVSWAHNVPGVATCWMIGLIPNTILFGLFALHVLRRVHGRWEQLGGDQVDDVWVGLGAGSASKDSQLAGLEALISVAAVQRKREC